MKITQHNLLSLIAGCHEYGRTMSRSAPRFLPGKPVKSLAMILALTGVAAAQSYTAVPLPTANGFNLGFANLIGLNNKGLVLGDACNGNCSLHRIPAVWSNGAMSALPIPSGYVYTPVLSYYAINDSGAVVGTLNVSGASTNHIFVWTPASTSPLVYGPPTMVPDGPTNCGTTNISSVSSGLNAAGHILGSTTNHIPVQGCGTTWVYDGTAFHPLAYPHCSPPLNVDALGETFNNADLVLKTAGNNSCMGSSTYDPILIQAHTGKISFMPLGNLAGAVGVAVNDLGDVLGCSPDCGSGSHVVIWDGNGVHDLGPGGYQSLNQAGQVVYQSTGSQTTGVVALWQNGVSTPIPLAFGLSPGHINDAGQFVAGNGAQLYLFSPTGACGQDVTSQVQATRGGFRLNHSTGHFTQTVTVTNTGGSSITGPISLALDNVPSNATLFGIAGDTLCAVPQGSPYINISSDALNPGASVTGMVEFIDTANTGITYSIRALAGPGGR